MTDDTERAQPLDLWSCIRRDFLAGEPASLLAERYAMSERTIRRHAAMHGWRRRDSGPAGHADHLVRSRTMDDVISEHPSLAPVVEMNTEDLAELLLHPNPNYLRHFAFKRAAEEAALDRPAGCLAWMRIVEAMNRSGERIVREEWHFSPADRIRAAFVGANKDWGEPPSDAEQPRP